MPTLYRAARVADADLTGWLDDAAVRVEGGLVDAVLAARELPTDAATTHHLHDLGEVSLLPGFVETHVHMHYPSSLDYRDIARPEPVERMLIRATANMRRLLLSGATTARDTGSRDDVALAVRAALRDGIAPGPRLLVTGAPITTTGGHYWFLGAEADTTDEVVRRIRERKRLGVVVRQVGCRQRRRCGMPVAVNERLALFGQLNLHILGGGLQHNRAVGDRQHLVEARARLGAIVIL